MRGEPFAQVNQSALVLDEADGQRGLDVFGKFRYRRRVGKVNGSHG
jgi:hypothetical protein